MIKLKAYFSMGILKSGGLKEGLIEWIRVKRATHRWAESCSCFYTWDKWLGTDAEESGPSVDGWTAKYRKSQNSTFSKNILK